MIAPTGLPDLNSVVNPRLGFPFSKFSLKNSKINNFKGIRIRSCLLSKISLSINFFNKMALYLDSSKLKVRSKYLYLTWCAFEHQVRKSSLPL
jgi:hypothetical protein